MHRIILTALAFALAAPLVAAGAGPLSGPYLGQYTATLTRAQAAAKGDSRMAGKFTLWRTRNGRTFTRTRSTAPRRAASPPSRITGCASTTTWAARTAASSARRRHLPLVAERWAPDAAAGQRGRVHRSQRHADLSGLEAEVARQRTQGPVDTGPFARSRSSRTIDVGTP
jgi:hypothetical protein